MVRFPNPASDLRIFIKIFQEVYRQLKYNATFGLDDITQAMIKANLMSSSGHTGEKALELGKNKDRSRDKPYNNSKMFSEWFRILGWINSVGDTALIFQFTFLGVHIGEATANSGKLVEECLLGITNPNEVLNVKYVESVKLFKCTLMAMYHLDGRICRDELIIGPMCANDTSRQSFLSMVQTIKAIRGDSELLSTELQALCARLKIAANTARNYTRLPISFFNGVGWASSEEIKGIYSNSPVFLILTERGKAIAEKLENTCDIRLNNLASFSQEERDALIRLGFYEMLERADYDISGMNDQLTRDKNLCRAIIKDRPLHFSPYQVLNAKEVNEALGYVPFVEDGGSDYQSNKVQLFINKNEISRDTNSPLTVSITNALDTTRFDSSDYDYINEITRLIDRGLSPQDISEIFIQKYRLATQTTFYPLIVTIFKVLGFNCTKSRQGDNAERWDAIIIDEMNSIPIEIKSPTEEMCISMKAIRQALENKIILLSRNTHATSQTCTSLAVGFSPPSSRSDVSLLINDIKSTYGYSIAALDFISLVELTVHVIENGRTFAKDEFSRLEGVINAIHIATEI